VILVHARSRGSAYIAWWAARRTRTRFVTSYHGIYAARTPIKRWYNRIMARGDTVIVNSAFTRAHVIAEHGIDEGRIAVIPEGVDIVAFDPAAVSHERVQAARAAWGAGDGRPIVLLAGRLTGWKGHAVAIEAAARSRAKVWLVFLGAEGNPAVAGELARKAERAGGNLILAKTADDMPAALSAADIIIAPSTEPESFGRVVAEAGAMAKVVVASSLGGPAETIIDGQTGVLVPPGEAAALAEAIDHLLGMSGAARAAMGRAARERISSLYSIERMCEATFAVYRRLARP
jgi:glycosyltransferase involved in cell wall biosynthesis